MFNLPSEEHGRDVGVVRVPVSVGRSLVVGSVACVGKLWSSHAEDVARTSGVVSVDNPLAYRHGQRSRGGLLHVDDVDESAVLLQPFYSLVLHLLSVESCSLDVVIVQVVAHAVRTQYQRLGAWMQLAEVFVQRLHVFP